VAVVSIGFIVHRLPTCINWTDLADLLAVFTVQTAMLARY